MLIKRILRHWLPLAAIIVGLMGTIYVVAQQSLRLGANDPQGELARDAAVRISDGEPLASVVVTGTMDVEQSLGPFMMVFDQQGQVLVSGGLLHGVPPQLPYGVIDNAQENGEDRVTWQPEPGLRLAAVVVPAGGPQAVYVLAARSLQDTENIIALVGTLVGLGGVGTLVASLVVVALVEIVLADRNKKI